MLRNAIDGDRCAHANTRFSPMGRHCLMTGALCGSLLFMSTAAADDDPSLFGYAGCGEIVQGIECTMFQGDDGARIAMPNPEPFEIGDRVRVEGTVCMECQSSCMEGAILTIDTLRACRPKPFVIFDIIGEVTEIESEVFGEVVSCLVVAGSNGNCRVPENSELKVGDRVRLLGYEAPCDEFCGADVCLDAHTWVLQAHPGDADGDRHIGISDLLKVIGDWGQCPPPTSLCPADTAPVGAFGLPAGDGKVGIADLLSVLAHWG